MAVAGVIVSAAALASAETVADRARALLAQIEAEPEARALARHAVERANDALSRAAQPGKAPSLRGELELVALAWAEVARDLARARAAEQASDRLEQELSSVQTEIVRSRAAVEQAKARVGRARRQLEELEARTGRAASSAAPSTPAGKR